MQLDGADAAGGKVHGRVAGAPQGDEERYVADGVVSEMRPEFRHSGLSVYPLGVVPAPISAARPDGPDLAEVVLAVGAPVIVGGWLVVGVL